MQVKIEIGLDIGYCNFNEIEADKKEKWGYKVKTPDSYLIDEIVDRITDTVHPIRIILFGSAAREEMNRDSDLDLLIIMPEGIHRRHTSRKICQALRGIGMPKDIIVVTEQDVAEYGSNPSLILKPAIEEGRELYAAG